MTVPRRQFLQIAAVGGTSTLALSRLAGCSAAEPTAESPAPVEPEENHTLPQITAMRSRLMPD